MLLGVTGSGKTFTMAKVIEATQRPALILAPNKTLAAQLYGEFKSFFPDNAVEYFVSYYDYYQPEAYVPRTDTYIEKESDINEQIDRMRHAATRAVLERDDVIIVASVSCIYGIGSVETYTAMTFSLKLGDKVDQRQLIADLVALQYKRSLGDFSRGIFRVRGDTIEIFPAHYEDRAWRVGFFGDEIEAIAEFDPLTGQKTADLEFVKIYANSHYVTPRPTLLQSLAGIKPELKIRLDELHAQGRLLEAQRLEQRTVFDLEMLEATGSCAGIENYSRYLTGRRPGEPPPTLFEYLPDNALIFADESHVTIPQIGGMYRGDYRRKATLAEYGFRLPSCMDNRPLRFEEWDAMRPQTVSRLGDAGALGAGADRRRVRRAGDPPDRPDRPAGRGAPGARAGRRPARARSKEVAQRGYRSLVTVLTKRMAEDLTEYLHENGVRVRYMHSDIDTIERIEIIRDLRLGAFDVLVGINLLREGLDIPECALVAILDADKEGFLRSETSLVQTIGRAARNVDGKVILYADHDHRLDGAGDGGDPAPAGEADRLQRGERHHAGDDQARHPGHSGLGRGGRPRHRRRRPRRRARPSATTCTRRSPTWRSGCARRPATSNSRRRRACATRSSACRRSSSRSATTRWRGRPTSRRRRARSPASASTAAPRTCPPTARTSRATRTWARTISAAARRGRRAEGRGGGDEAPERTWPLTSAILKRGAVPKPYAPV